jgi:hypothetical protein
MLKMESGRRAAKKRGDLREAKEVLAGQPRMEGLQ